MGAEIMLTVDGELRKARLFRSREPAELVGAMPTRGDAGGEGMGVTPDSQVDSLAEGNRRTAKNRRGLPCRCPAMRDKRRFRLHGGKSTGPRTPEGVQALRSARTVHGFYRRAAIAERREAQAAWETLVQLLDGSAPRAHS